MLLSLLFLKLTQLLIVIPTLLQFIVIILYPALHLLNCILMHRNGGQIAAIRFLKITIAPFSFYLLILLIIVADVTADAYDKAS